MEGTSLQALPMRAGSNPLSLSELTAGQARPTIVKTTTMAGELDLGHHQHKADETATVVPDTETPQ